MWTARRITACTARNTSWHWPTTPPCTAWTTLVWRRGMCFSLARSTEFRRADGYTLPQILTCAYPSESHKVYIMPILHWLNKDQAVTTAQKTTYRLLEEVPELSCGDPASGNLLIQGDNLEALKALRPFYAG